MIREANKPKVRPTSVQPLSQQGIDLRSFIGQGRARKDRHRGENLPTTTTSSVYVVGDCTRSALASARVCARHPSRTGRRTYTLALPYRARLRHGTSRVGKDSAVCLMFATGRRRRRGPPTALSRGRRWTLLRCCSRTLRGCTGGSRLLFLWKKVITGRVCRYACAVGSEGKGCI